MTEKPFSFLGRHSAQCPCCTGDIFIPKENHEEINENLMKIKINEDENISELIFLGSGSSGGVPTISHLICSEEQYNQASDAYKQVINNSRRANIGDPRNNKNYRCNPSLLIKYRPIADKENQLNIIIDVGKTFRESAGRWLPQSGINSIDAVVLTHGHADAIFGLDDLRSVHIQNIPINVYQSKECEDATRRIFNYLYSDYLEKDATRIQRFVSNIHWNRIEEYKSFQVNNKFEMIPIPVMHGEDMICYGFLFGKQKKVCYLSDISRVLPETLECIQGYGQIDILIVDALNLKTCFPTHFNLPQTIDFVRLVKPKKTYTIGMNASIEHEEINRYLKTITDVDIELAYDGLTIPIEL